jgi:hypothetical protein
MLLAMRRRVPPVTGPLLAVPPTIAHALLSVVAVSLLAGCPGEISDPQRFFEDGHDGAPLPCGMPETCSGSLCHSGSEPAADLDLVATDPAARLVDVPSVTCEGRLLIDSEHPEASFLLEKVAASEPECGAPMPFIGDGLTPAEVQCVEDFIRDLLEGGDTGDPDDAGVSP